MNISKAALFLLGLMLSVSCSTAAPAREGVQTRTPFLPANTPVAAFPPRIGLEKAFSVPGQITYLTHAGDGSSRLFVVERAGRVWIYSQGELLREPFLDISDMVDDASSEQGLLSIAFPPGYAQNGQFYVNYTNLESDNDTIVARYRVSRDPNRADPDSGQVILFIEQPANNHNGGQLQFGPDGNLYIGMGDGGRGNDPWDNAENRAVLLGKLLRIDVQNQETYVIPQGNPYADRPEFRPEIWAYGLRNPWRFSFDRLTGDLYIADVGQNEWEEVNFQPAGSAGGEHYGWDTLEGTHCFEPAAGCQPGGKIMPVAEYNHSDGCSITGGYVYRGQRYPALWGTYFYGDYCSGKIWGLHWDEAGGWQSALLLETQVAIASFGEDEAGELYVLDLGGDIFRLAGEQ